MTENIDQVIISKNIWKAFGENQVLKNFTFELKRGENVVVLGKSGSGKSVFIKCLIGLIPIDKGEIFVLGQSINNLNSDEIDRLRMKIGFLFQSNALYDSMTVRENLEFPLRRHLSELSSKDVDIAVKEALSNVGLSHTENMMPSELSGGMKKRIAIARTLILKPEIILYDEPTTGLDPITGKEISELIIAIQKKYKTSSVIISHDMNCVKIVSNRIVLLLDGKSYKEGTYQEMSLMNEPLVKGFFS